MTGPTRTPGLGLIVAGLSAAIGVVALTGMGRSLHVDRAGPGRVTAAPELRLDLNDADAAELTLLPGIGATMAERIVADRESRGDFDDVDALRRVSGVGPATVERIAPFVCGRPHETPGTDRYR